MPSNIVNPNLKNSRLVSFSLIFSNFAIRPIRTLAGLLLIDIGLTFNCTVGIIGQIHTFSYALGMITALIMTALSTWFKHKFLLLIGLLFLSISALGCGLAQNLELMIIFYSLSGIGISMTIPMITTIIGDQYPLDQRTKVIGWVIASGALSIVVAAPIISIMSDMGG